MKWIALSVMTVIVAASVSPACAQGVKAPSSLPQVKIFNGKNLNGWEVMGGNKQAFFVTPDGEIEATGQGGGWLRYTEEADNFILKMKYKLTEGANSGIFLRAKKEGDPPFTGFEVQILDTYGKDPNKHSAGAIYDVLTPMREMSKPVGEWNEVTIKCNGGIVIVWLNGFKIIDTDFDQLTEPIGKFSTPYAQLPKSGFIGVQDHGNRLWFKDIYLTRLPSSN